MKRKKIIWCTVTLLVLIILTVSVYLQDAKRAPETADNPPVVLSEELPVPQTPDIGSTSQAFAAMQQTWEAANTKNQKTISLDIASDGALISEIRSLLESKNENELSKWLNNRAFGEREELGGELIQFLIVEKEVDKAFEFATLILQANPASTIAKEQYAKIYTLIAEELEQKQHEIISRGKQ